MVTMLEGAQSVDQLVRQYAVRSPRWVRANFVTTLDGHATGSTGLSGSINSPADKRVFDLLRALSDVVVVGAGTIRAEGYGRLRTETEEFLTLRRDAGRSDHPTLAVVTASGDVPEEVLADDSDAGDLLVLCAEAVRRDLVERLGEDAVIACGTDQVEGGPAIDALHERGFNQVLTEGGPHLLGTLVQAGVLDELCLTVRSLLVGGTGPRIMESAALHESTGAFDLTHIYADEGDLMLRLQNRRADTVSPR